MSDDLDELYQQVILDHCKSPRNFHELPGANRKGEGHNPLCGDRVNVYVRERNGVVEDIKFVGSGCAISQASASLMTECVKGKTKEEAKHIFEEFQKLVTSDPSLEPEIEEEAESLLPLAGVREFPIRVKCATLAWHTLEEALNH